MNILRDASDILEEITRTSLGSVPYVICENAVAVGALQGRNIFSKYAKFKNLISEHPAAIEMFEIVRKIDPYRIEHMNHYADSLYVRENVEDLYVLGRFFEKSHKYTWQCCQIIGNFLFFITVEFSYHFSQLFLFNKTT